MLRADTFHGLLLIIIICIVGAPVILPAIMIICAVYIGAMISFAAFHTVMFFYRGFRHGDWTPIAVYPGGSSND